MLNMTEDERKVILFLAIVALLGAGVKFLSKKVGGSFRIINVSQNLGKVNLNSANKRMLTGVSGIGEKLADRIIEYRQENSGFTALEDLKKIKGINPAKFNKISSYLCVE